MVCAPWMTVSGRGLTVFQAVIQVSSQMGHIALVVNNTFTKRHLALFHALHVRLDHNNLNNHSHIASMAIAMQFVVAHWQFGFVAGVQLVSTWKDKQVGIAQCAWLAHLPMPVGHHHAFSALQALLPKDLQTQTVPSVQQTQMAQHRVWTRA